MNKQVVVKIVNNTKFEIKGNNLENSGIDLFVNEIEDKGNYLMCKTGVRVQPPKGFYFDMVPRSSSFKKGLILYNCVGIIDQSYTGEIVAVFLKTQDYKEENSPKIGDRLAQLILRRVFEVSLENVSLDELEKTTRGDGGFGSSGH